MTDSGIVGLLLIIVNLIVSYQGFTKKSFMRAYCFDVDRILIGKDYKRILTSGFLHVSWWHLIFNMLSLIAFSSAIERALGSTSYLVIYFASLIGGNLLSLFIHRNHSDYTAVGASGAVCGIIFASIALFPDMGVGFFLIPFSIPAWIYGIVYVGISIYGIRSSRDNIGHDAHLGGALIGMIVAVLMEPSALTENYTTILLIAIPTIAFIVLIILRPHFLLVDNFYFKTHHNFYSVDHRYNAERSERQREIDRILDKIGKKGMESLSSKERAKLKEHSRKIR